MKTFYNKNPITKKYINMLGLKNAQTLVGLLTIFLAYLFTIAPVGYFRAWVAKKMGDDTGQELGFLTLNPLVHIDFFGVMVLLLFAQPEAFYGFGWGKHIPINPHNIHGRWRWLRLSCAFFSDAFAHFMLAAVALMGLSLLFGKQMATILFSQSSSFPTVINHLLFAFIMLNVSLVVVQCAINLVILFAFYAVEDNWQLSTHMYFIVFLAPVVIIFLFGSQLHQLILYSVLTLGTTLANIF